MVNPTKNKVHNVELLALYSSSKYCYVYLESKQREIRRSCGIFNGRLQNCRHHSHRYVMFVWSLKLEYSENYSGITFHEIDVVPLEFHAESWLFFIDYYKNFGFLDLMFQETFNSI